MKKLEKWDIFVALVPQSLVNLLTYFCFDYFAFSVFLLFEFANDTTKLSPIPQNMRGEKTFLTYLPGGRNFSGLQVIAKIVQ